MPCFSDTIRQRDSLRDQGCSLYLWAEWLLSCWSLQLNCLLSGSKNTEVSTEFKTWYTWWYIQTNLWLLCDCEWHKRNSTSRTTRLLLSGHYAKWFDQSESGLESGLTTFKLHYWIIQKLFTYLIDSLSDINRLIPSSDFNTAVILEVWRDVLWMEVWFCCLIVHLRERKTESLIWKLCNKSFLHELALKNHFRWCMGSHFHDYWLK